MTHGKSITLQEIQPGTGKWLVQGRVAPKPKKPKPQVRHWAALAPGWDADEWRQARNDRKRIRRARAA